MSPRGNCITKISAFTKPKVFSLIVICSTNFLMNVLGSSILWKYCWSLPWIFLVKVLFLEIGIFSLNLYMNLQKTFAFCQVLKFFLVFKKAFDIKYTIFVTWTRSNPKDVRTLLLLESCKFEQLYFLRNILCIFVILTSYGFSFYSKLSESIL